MRMQKNIKEFYKLTEKISSHNISIKKCWKMFARTEEVKISG